MGEPESAGQSTQGVPLGSLQHAKNLLKLLYQKEGFAFEVDFFCLPAISRRPSQKTRLVHLHRVEASDPSWFETLAAQAPHHEGVGAVAERVLGSGLMEVVTSQ